jgi:hypothetical protein
VDGEVVGARLAGHELVAASVVDDAGTPGQLTVALPGSGGTA